MRLDILPTVSLGYWFLSSNPKVGYAHTTKVSAVVLLSRRIPAMMLRGVTLDWSSRKPEVAFSWSEAAGFPKPNWP